jgi:hypothetical protein
MLVLSFEFSVNTDLPCRHETFGKTVVLNLVAINVYCIGTGDLNSANPTQLWGPYFNSEVTVLT